MSLPERLAEATLAKIAKKKELAKLEGDTPFLDFLTELFTQLLPILIGCLGVSAAADEARKPGLLVRARLRLAIRRQLGDRESIDLLAGPMFDAILEAGKTVTEKELAAFAAA